MNIEGQCHCGQVAYRAEIDPQKVAICHCNDCQALTGCAFRISVSTPREAISLSGTPPKVYRKIAESGRARLLYFCADCGSPLFSSGEDPDQGEWGIRWGSIRQRRELAPQRQKWCRSAVDWLDRIDALPAREQE
ncbi:GFA family protein [Pseudomonas sp. RIT-PI-AD]|uniref:GFA family protein n=1 Tax=Pseudomonas sp. RIT-PI-AD TaxID=3035294 RepID=UPI0021D8194B|nr:GFA family protein [Pseudomonas sp. RIT-PI-AD]